MLRTALLGPAISGYLEDPCHHLERSARRIRSLLADQHIAAP